MTKRFFIDRNSFPIYCEENIEAENNARTQNILPLSPTVKPHAHRRQIVTYTLQVLTLK